MLVEQIRILIILIWAKQIYIIYWLPNNSQYIKATQYDNQYTFL